MFNLSSADRPDYDKALSILENTIPIYYDADLLKNELEKATKSKEEYSKKLQYLKDTKLKNKIDNLSISAKEDYTVAIKRNNLISLLKTKFNPNSHNQIKDILLNAYDISESVLSYRGKLSTRSEVIEKIYATTKNPFIEALIKYRDCDNTIKCLKDIVNYAHLTDYVNKDGHHILAVKPSWGHTVSSRFTTKNPNIQGMKRELRNLNTAREGYKILSIDIRQQELVIYFNSIVKEPNLIKAFTKYNDDYYMTITKFCTARDILLKNLSEYCRERNYDTELILKSNETTLLKKVTFKSIDTTAPTLEKKNGRFGLKYSYDNEILSDLTFKSLVIAEGLQSNDSELTHRINSRLKAWGDIVFAKSIYDLAEIKFDKSKRDGYKLTTLMSMYGASKTSIEDKVNSDIVESLFDMIKSSKAYSEYDKFARYNIKRGNLTVKSTFGTLSTIEKRDFGYMYRCFFNRPAQTTGADICAFILTNFDKWKHNLNLEEDSINIMYSLYDEVNIHIREDLLHLIDDILNLMEFKINDWTPMYVEHSLGDYNNG